MKPKTNRLILGLALSAFFGGSVALAQTTISLNRADYTTPAWTAIQRALASLPSAESPYCINMTVNGDPSSRMAFTWFTDPGVADGEVRIVAKADAKDSDFDTPDFIVKAAAIEVKGLNYSIERNMLEGIAPNQKADYVAHKALADGLAPGTTYSFRVGKEGAWSETGSFSTASGTKDESYSFIYITDTQAQNDEMFGVSQKTIHSALETCPDAAFVLCNGDLVETSGSSNSEWEYEQWFSTMQDVWLRKPLVVTMGNHDRSDNGNFGYHFNNSSDYNDTAEVKTTMDGTVFSFVRGDALYMVISYEDYSKPGYLESLASWMRRQVETYSDAKWRIVSFHKNMFTGSRSHQDDADGKAVREKMLPVFEELNIDMAFQGHDHIYEVVGPVRNADKTLIADAVESVEIVGEGNQRENMTGRQRGVFDVTDGTLYFLNNSAGKKKYEPRTREEMAASFGKHGIEDYWGLFSGKFGQTGEPTFSKVSVDGNGLEIITYTVDDKGNASVFDSFRVKKSGQMPVSVSECLEEKAGITIDDDGNVMVSGIEAEKTDLLSTEGVVVKTAAGGNLNVSDVQKGIYIVRATSANGIYSKKTTI